MEDIGIFYDRKVYFTAIWYILLPFDIFYGNLIYFSNFGILYQEKSGNPGPNCQPTKRRLPNFNHQNVNIANYVI
jgi:hypothetical protein